MRRGAGLYRLPWSKTDNAGGWVEVTDQCDLHCPGCYRRTLEGHRPLEEVCEDIRACQAATGCDRIGIAGGEPLLYPHLTDVVAFIARRGMKPMLLTNGERLTPDMARELKKAGLRKFHFHVDGAMPRPGWEGRTEAEMNDLRQHFADLVWELGGVQCGYNITVFPSSVDYLPDVVGWCRRNIAKVQHVSLVAFRSVPLTGEYEYRVGDRAVDPAALQHSSPDLAKIRLTTEDMLRKIQERMRDFRPAVYLPGTAVPESHKFLVTLQVGTRDGFLGLSGARTAEFVQVFHHLFTGRYFDFLARPDAGRKLFLLVPLDRELRRTLGRYLAASLKNPRVLGQRVYVQSISLQQPNEIVDGQVNLCDGCPNMMIHRGQLIPSCRLDEYRLFGGAAVPVRKGRRPEAG